MVHRVERACNLTQLMYVCMGVCVSYNYVYVVAEWCGTIPWSCGSWLSSNNALSSSASRCELAYSLASAGSLMEIIRPTSSRRVIFSWPASHDLDDADPSRWLHPSHPHPLHPKLSHSFTHPTPSGTRYAGGVCAFNILWTVPLTISLLFLLLS